jgi:cyanophycinase
MVRRLIVCLMISLLLAIPAAAQPQPIGHLIPIGGGYSDVYAGFSQAAVANAKDQRVNIVVLPMTYSSNADAITDAERAVNRRDAEERRFQIEEACQRAAPTDYSCTATLAPIFTRGDATDPATLQYFTDDLTAVFILGGDQTIAMQALIDTPLEEALRKAYERGVIVAGTSAGGGMQSAAMLAGYNPNFAAANSLQFGASDVWNTPEKHGLLFSIKNAILDQHFFQRGRLGRLLNAIALPDVPHIGIGVDAYTGVNVYDETRVQDVFGLYTTAILDAETYHAADAVQYSTPGNWLSLRNVLVHLLSPGQFSYDLDERVMTIGARAQPPQAKLIRAFNALTLPPAAGPLILAGDLSEALEDNVILDRFVELSGGEQARILIVATGYPSEKSAQTAAEKYAAALDTPSQIVVVTDASEPLSIPDDATGLLLIAKDQSKVAVNSLGAIKTAWRNGLPVLADNGGAAIIGRKFSAHGPTPKDAEQAELAVQKSFIAGATKIADGLGLLDITVEPQVLNDNRWGRLFSLAYSTANTVAFGLTQHAALEITADGARAIGDNATFALDLRNAARELGTNDGWVIANGLLDVFVPGDRVEPMVADIAYAPTPAATPAPSATPIDTPTPTSTPTVAPTSTPVATATAAPIPTAMPADTAATNAALPVLPIALGVVVIAVVVVLLAIRRRK